jgi:N-acetylmuramoyl-L-alanine amidase
MGLLRRLVFLLMLLAPVSALAKPAVTDARIGADGNLTRIELQVSAAPKFHVFYVPDPDRIVIDLDEVDWRVAAGHRLQGTGLVTALRYGLYKAGTSRVVLDLQQPAIVETMGADDQQKLVIDLRPVSAADFSLAVHGGTVPPATQLAAAPADAANDTSATAPSDNSKLPDQGVVSTNVSNKVGAAGGKATSKAASKTEAVAQDIDKAQQNSGKLDATTAPATTKTVANAVPAKSKAKIKPMIVIDAGHGGVDPGALGSGVMEKNITLSVAQALKKELLATGRYRVMLTRETDIYIPLRDRFKVARDNGADLFISLHADSHNDPFMRGASVYTLSETASDAEAADLANQENKSDIIAGVDLSKQSGMVTDILIDLAQRDTINQSNSFAVSLVSELKSDTLMLEHSHRSAGFAVLKAPDVPSVLIEMGYVSSQKDEALLTNKQHQGRLAKAIRRAIDDFFSGREPVRPS